MVLVGGTSNDLSPDSWVQKRRAKRWQPARRTRPAQIFIYKIVIPTGRTKSSVSAASPSISFAAFAHCQAFAHFQIGFYQLNAILVQISYLSLPPLRIMATFLRSSLLLLALVRAQPRLWIPNPYSPLLYGFGIISKAEIDFPFLLCTVFRVAFALADFPRLGDTTRFTYK